MTTQRLYRIYENHPDVFSAECLEIRPNALPDRFLLTRHIGEAYRTLAGAKQACKRWGAETIRLKWTGDKGRGYWEAEGTTIE